MLYDSLQDVLKHTHNLGFLESVKLTGTADDVSIEALATDRSVVMYGTLTDPIEGLEDQVVGLTRMSVLNGYVNFKDFSADGSSITIKTQERSGETIPSELEFSSVTGHTASYRFMAREVVEDQIKVPKFKGATWDITYSPTAKNLQDLVYFTNILGSYEPTFSVVVDGKNVMKLSIGSASSDRSLVPLATGITAKFNSAWRWPLASVLSILKLGSSSKSTMYFSSEGALKIEIDSGLGVYEYILPGRK